MKKFKKLMIQYFLEYQPIDLVFGDTTFHSNACNILILKSKSPTSNHLQIYFSPVIIRNVVAWP